MVLPHLKKLENLESPHFLLWPLPCHQKSILDQESVGTQGEEEK